MRVLYFAESHGRFLDDHLLSQDPSLVVLGMWISGAKMHGIEWLIGRRLPEIIDFSPDVVFLHLGHNDLSYHVKHNPQPMKCPDAAVELHAIVIALKEFLPQACIIVSCPFPRVSSGDYTQEQALSYNRVAKRFCDRIGERKLNSCFCKDLWFRIKTTEGNPVYFKEDGLHLLPIGKRAVVRTWLRACVKYNVRGSHLLAV